MAVDLDQIREQWRARRRNRVVLRTKAVQPAPQSAEPMDPNGGILPADMGRAQKVDLLTLPEGIDGKNCDTCRYMDTGSGYCTNPEVEMMVNKRQGCKLWDAEGVYRAWEQEESSEKSGLDLPDVRQEAGWACGPAALRAVAQHFGVGPDSEEDYIELVGANEKDGTPPEALVAGAEALGLSVEAREGMTIEDLAECTAAGKPVICAIQKTGDGDTDSRGHYVVVLGVNDDGVEVHDPVDGRKTVDRPLWDDRWHDKSAEGVEYDHWGMEVGPPDRYASRKGWITLSARDQSGDEHGNVHVYIDDAGKITKGPSHLEGKKVGELSATHRVTAAHGNNKPAGVKTAHEQATAEEAVGPKHEAAARVQAVLSDSLHEARLSTAQRKQYQAAVRRATRDMPAAAHERIAANLKAVRFAADSTDIPGHLLGDMDAQAGDESFQATLARALGQGHLTGAKREQVVKDYIEQKREQFAAMKGRTLAGCYFGPSGGLYLDGGYEGASSHEGPGEFRTEAGGGKALHAGIYAHELGHVIDGPGYEFSRSDAWQGVFEGEIAPDGEHRLNGYASSMRKEAFAEFCRLVYSGQVKRSRVEEAFPKATQFFKDNGLWPEK